MPQRQGRLLVAAPETGKDSSSRGIARGPKRVAFTCTKVFKEKLHNACRKVAKPNVSTERFEQAFVYAYTNR